MYSFLIENDLISSNQSGFNQGNSSINHLLSITHNIYQSLDWGYEVHSVFLDVSNVFDKVCQKNLILKLEQNGIGDLKILTGFLKLQTQRIFVNGQNMFLCDVFANASQGSILSPLLFLIYINKLSDSLQCKLKLFTDYTSLFATPHNINRATNDLNNI